MLIRLTFQVSIMFQLLLIFLTFLLLMWMQTRGQIFLQREGMVRAPEGKLDILVLEGKWEFQHARGTYHKGKSKDAERKLWELSQVICGRDASGMG